MSKKEEIKDYPKDENGEWTRAMFPGDTPIKKFSDGTVYDPNDPDHFSHPF